MPSLCYLLYWHWHCSLSCIRKLLCNWKFQKQSLDLDSGKGNQPIHVSKVHVDSTDKCCKNESADTFGLMSTQNTTACTCYLVYGSGSGTDASPIPRLFLRLWKTITSVLQIMKTTQFAINPLLLHDFSKDLNTYTEFSVSLNTGYLTF